MFKSWKTTLVGLANLGCTIASIIAPETIPICAKIAGCVNAAGFMLAKDHDAVEAVPGTLASTAEHAGKPQTRPISTSRMLMLLGIGLSLFVCCSGFIGTGVNKTPFIFVGSGNPTNPVALAAPTGSFYVNNADTNIPVLWIKTTTNFYARFISSNSLPRDMTFDNIICTNINCQSSSIFHNDVDVFGDVTTHGNFHVTLETIFDGNVSINYLDANDNVYTDASKVLQSGTP